MPAKSPRPDFSNRLSALPTEPGVYLMKDEDGRSSMSAKRSRCAIVCARTSSRSGDMDPKTRELVTHIVDFDVIRTDTATEALMLENELIKRYLPKYNVMLKDSKTYPYLKITNEEWPRIISTRRIVNDGGRYFRTVHFSGNRVSNAQPAEPAVSISEMRKEDHRP